MSFLVVLFAALTYTATMALGIAASVSGRKFGRWHHGMYLVSCIAATAAILVTMLWTVVPVLVVLGLLPFTRAGTLRHAVVGTCGWIAWMFVLWYAL